MTRTAPALLILVLSTGCHPFAEIGDFPAGTGLDILDAIGGDAHGDAPRPDGGGDDTGGGKDTHTDQDDVSSDYAADGDVTEPDWDTTLDDTNLYDTTLDDTTINDTDVSDTDVSDTDVSDTDVSDTEPYDTEPYDTEPYDTEPYDTNPDTADDTTDTADGSTDCPDGWGDCNGNYADGCETNLYLNSYHCGSCGISCDPYTCFDGNCSQ